MKFDLPRVTAVAVPLLPLLLLVHACDCPCVGTRTSGQPAAACEMPPLPRLPRS